MLAKKTNDYGWRESEYEGSLNDAFRTVKATDAGKN
jgi:hypothetical protein